MRQTRSALGDIKVLARTVVGGRLRSRLTEPNVSSTLGACTEPSPQAFYSRFSFSLRGQSTARHDRGPIALSTAARSRSQLAVTMRSRPVRLA